MKVRTFLSLIAATLTAVLMLAIGAGTGSARSDVQQAPAATYKVALVTDIGGLDDRSFNFLANKGLNDAKKKFGAVVALDGATCELRPGELLALQREVLLEQRKVRRDVSDLRLERPDPSRDVGDLARETLQDRELPGVRLGPRDVALEHLAGTRDVVDVLVLHRADPPQLHRPERPVALDDAEERVNDVRMELSPAEAHQLGDRELDRLG